MVRRALEVATPSCKFANAIFVSLRAIHGGGKWSNTAACATRSLLGLKWLFRVQTKALERNLEWSTITADSENVVTARFFAMPSVI